MKKEEFMNQKVSEMTISELANAIRIKHKQTYEKIIPEKKDYLEVMFEKNKMIKKEMRLKLVPIMNEKGITWCSSFVSNFISAVYVIPDYYDEECIKSTMKGVSRIVWDYLSTRYKEFDLKVINIPKVVMEVLNKVHTILLSSMGDGFRKCYMSPHHIDNPFFDDLKGMSGWGMFKKKEEKK